MRYVVAYDICEPKRLRRVAKVCEDYGLRIQKSVFELQVHKPMLEEMMGRLKEEIKPTEDSIISIPFCAACATQRIELGIPLFQEIPDVLIA